VRVSDGAPRIARFASHPRAMPARLINSHSTRLPGRADRRSIARFSAVRLPHLARTVAPEHRLRPNLATSDSRFV